ncbi:MAG: Gfo/Idh/MocA family oxidoreductase [bacterium]|nr:Gfo/Idh/MocA family oxidoreductase [bacterium]
MTNPVRIGLIGLGQRGLQHLNCLWRIDGARVVALCDPFPENLAPEKIERFVPGYTQEGIRTYSHFADLLGAGDVDALYFCIPPNRHKGEVIAAANAGLHVFVEKPVSLYFDEAVAMESAIRSAGVIGTVGFNQRHDHKHEGIRDFLRDKRLVMANAIVNGTLESHSAKHTRTEELGGPGNRVWAASAAWSGTTVVEAGIHQLDTMRYWAGDVAWVRADYVHRDAADIEDGGDNPYAYSVTFGFASGFLYNLSMARLRKTFYGDGYSGLMWDHGHVKIEGEEIAAYYYEGPYPPPPGAPSAAELRHIVAMPAKRDGTFHINECFVQAVANNDVSLLRNTFSSSMNSHAAVLAANLSDRLGGRKIQLDSFATSAEFADFRRKPNQEI